MRIIGSTIAMQSSRAFESGSKERTNLRVVDGEREINLTEQRSSATSERSREITVSAINSGGLGPGTGLDIDSLLLSAATPEDDELMDPKSKLTKDLLEQLLGKKIKLARFKQGDEGEQPPNKGVAAGGAPPPAGGSGGFGFAFERVVTRYEAEKTDFHAGGSVKTADGKTIDFAVELSMARQFVSHEETSLRGGVLTDPLVLNFDGGAAELSDERFQFDLDADGNGDQVHFLRPGSAFLSFDRNGDGTINDGTELFGAKTGDGFAELAAYDDDGNQFIDEGDAIFSQLSLYNQTGSGQQLTSLADAGVGAIYLGSASTEFSLNSVDDNSQQGQIRETGIFLNENGSVGTVQQVDLAVYEQEPSPATPAEDSPLAAVTALAESQGIDLTA